MSNRSKFTISNRPTITNREGVIMQGIVRSVAKSNTKRLSAQQEAELGELALAGDGAARNRLTEANLGVVLSVAKVYQGRGLSLEDLYSEGVNGLITASQKFDPSKGTRFTTYAVPWIHQSIVRGLQKNGCTIRLPKQLCELSTKLFAAANTFFASHGYEASYEELAEMLGAKFEDVAYVYATRAISPSLDASWGEGEDGDALTLLDVYVNPNAVSADRDLMKESMSSDISAALHTLSERDSLIVKKAFGIGVMFPSSYEDIADEFGLTCERVRQICNSACKTLRKGPYAEVLKSYLSQAA